jgi:hypothetical protein
MPHTRVTSIHVISRTYDYGLVSTFASETLGLFILFVLWLVGAAIATVCLRPPYNRLFLIYKRLVDLGRPGMVPHLSSMPCPHSSGCLRLDGLHHGLRAPDRQPHVFHCEQGFQAADARPL